MRRILLVPDSLYWVTANIAHEIVRHNPGLEFEVWSEPVVQAVLKRFAGYPRYFDLVHFLTPHSANRLAPSFAADTAVVSTLHHIESEACTATLEACDAVMTGTTQWVRELRAIGLPEEQIVQVPYGVDTELFRPPTTGERAAVRAELDLPEDLFVVGLCAKRSSKTRDRKGTDVFEAAIRRLAGSGAAVGCVTLGPGWQSFAREQSAAGIPSRYLQYTPTMEGLARWYRALDVLWVTSRIEGGPMPVLEAMATAVPCVTTPVGIPLDVIEDGRNGLLVPFDEPGALCEATLRLARDRRRREELGRAARATVVDRCRWAVTAPAAERLYRVALRRFADRAGAADGEADSPPPERWRRWMEAREHSSYARHLRGKREYEAADVLARRALRAQPLDPRLWWNAGVTGVLRAVQRVRPAG